MHDSLIKKGFTVIELVITIAILIIIFGMVFSGLTSFLRLRTAYDQEMILQQNFRYAISRITDDLRQGSKPQNATYDIILEPQDNAMGEELIFTSYDGKDTYDIRYRMESKENGSNENAVFRVKYLHGTTPGEEDKGDPVTDYMKQLVKLYFVRQGGKVFVIMVGRLNYFGRESTISYTSLIFSRNSNEQNP